MNDDFFFYQEDGQTRGPVSSDEVKERIRKGRIRLFDLILREGEASWRMALEHGEFKTEFKDKSKSALRERPWVCLQRKSPDGFDFVTTGPFSEEDVREGLLAGRVSYSDYAWRSGFSEWKRIGLIEDFNPRLKREVKPPERPPDTGEELLKNVVEIRRPRAPLPELPPEDAATDDLTKGPVSAPPPIPVSLQPEVPPPETPIEEAPSPRAKRKRKTVPWLDWGIVGILVVVLGAVTLVLSRNIKRSRLLDVPATTVLETVPPPPINAPVEYEPEEAAPPEAELAVPEEPEAPPSPAPVKEPPEKPEKKVSRAPTELYLSVQNRSKNQARVEVRTNGTAEYPVYVQVVGVPGYVSTGPSFYRYLKLTPSGDSRKPLDLSKLKLPQGRLIFRAQTGDIRREAKLNVGTGEPQFKRSLGRIRKLHAYAIWSERLELLRMAELMETRLAAGDGQKLSSKGLETLSSVSKTSGYKFALFDDWYELKSILDDAKKQMTPGLAARAKRVREKMASFTIWK